MSSKGKDLILNKCFELLLLKGFDAVSISDIQNATGMSRGLIYHHYKNKEELFMEVVGKYLLELFIIDPQEVKDFNIEQMINFTHDVYSKICKSEISGASENISIVNYDFLFYQAMLKSKSFELKYRKVRDDELKAWEIVVANSKNSKLIAADADIKTIAKTFVYILDGSWFNINYRSNLQEAANEIRYMLNDYYSKIKCQI